MSLGTTLRRNHAFEMSSRHIWFELVSFYEFFFLFRSIIITDDYEFFQFFSFLKWQL